MIFDFKQARYNNVVIKLTSACNLECTYCYVASSKSKNGQMKENVLASIFDKYSSYTSTLEPENRFVFYIWHGGEPLMCGLDYFEKLISLQHQFDNRDTVVLNGVQTNGTLLNQQWLDFFARNSFSIGISLDGPQYVQSLRKGHGFDSFQAIEKNIKLMNQADMNFSVTSVVTNEMAPLWRDIYDYFSGLNVRYIDFLPCYNKNSDKFLSPENFEAFYLPLLRTWLADDPKRKPEIRLFSDFMKRIDVQPKGDITIGCEVIGQCGEIQYITENGDLYPCTVLPINNALRMGNIVRDDFKICLDSKNYIYFQKSYNKDCCCGKCDYFDICRGGCAARRLYPPNGQIARGKDMYCSGRQMIINSIKSHLLEKENEEN